jgi:predicted permease
MQDLLYAFRLMRRTPGVAITAIVSLALGVGVNALVFSVINGLVLRPLPGVGDPDRLVFLQNGTNPGQSYPNFVDLRDRSTAFDSLAGYRIAPMSVETGAGASGQPRRAWGYLATGSYFDTLRVTPAAGRFFHAAEDRNPGEPALAVLSYDEWTTHFGGSRDVIGSTLRINAHPFTIIGVAPRGFFGSEVFYRPAIWVPMMMEPVIEPHNWLDARATMNMWVVGRLKTGVSIPQAEANLAPVTADLARAYPWPDKNMVIRLARPGLLGNLLRTPVQAFGMAVMLLAGLVLVAACANLAGLLLARGADRQREMAIRLSIGAARARLVRQLLTESLVLALAGGLLGAATAAIGAAALSAWQIPVTLPMQLDVSVDWRVVVFACVVSTIAGLLFGVAPARFASATDPNLALKGGVQGPAGGRRWTFRDALIAVQVALCFVLVTACVLSARGLQRALAAPLGFAPRGVATASFDLGLAGYDKARGLEFQRRVAEEASRMPGATSAAFASTLPLSLDQSHSVVYLPGARTGDLAAANAVVYSVGPGYFRTMGISLTSGRDIDARDTATSTPVALVNETFVHKVLKTDHPVGMRFTYGPGGKLVEVIGVVADATYETIGEAPTAAAFNPAAQWYNPTTVVVVRSSLPEAETAAGIRQLVSRLDPSLPLYDVEGAEAMMWWAYLPSRAAAIALGVFGLLAISLAATGLHGLVAYAVSRRSREIAIRVAVGADARAVLTTVLGRTASLIAVGAVVGTALAVVAMRVLSSVLFGVPRSDVTVLATVALAMTLVGLVACWAPSRRALRLQPAALLKSE